MHFRKLELHEWQQFEKIDIEFHDRLTILTGANGSGKTTLLKILARHNGWNSTSLATPIKQSGSGVIQFLTRYFAGVNKSDIPVMGKIEYTNDISANIQVQNSNAAQYQIQIANQQPIKCFFIPSHRSIYRYQPLSNIPTAKKDKNTAFSEISNSIQQKYQNGNEQNSGSYFMKNTLIGWAIQGYGVQSQSKSIMPQDDEQIRNYEGFQEVLKKILPKSLGFMEFEIRNMEVVFICNNGNDEFILETASGGISALIDIAWQIYMYSTKENLQCTVLIDEIENHLHPTMQRQILSDLISAFPEARFIVSTHSPLVVGSVRDSSVYALSYNENNKIQSLLLDFDKKARTAAEILDEVLGVSVTMPLWAEDKLNDIINRYAINGFQPNDFATMRGELVEAGLERLMPTAISTVLGGAND